jgi:hypothetical protein
LSLILTYLGEKKQLRMVQREFPGLRHERLLTTIALQVDPTRGSTGALEIG